MSDTINYSEFIKVILLEIIKINNTQKDQIALTDQSAILRTIREKGIGNLTASSFTEVLKDNLYFKLYPYLFNTFEHLGTTNGEFIYISVFLTALVKHIKPQNLKRDIRTINEALNNPYVQNSESIRPEIQSLYESLKLLDLSNSIAHIICVMRYCIRTDEEKDKAVIISEVLNTLCIHDKHPFMTLEEANKEADRIHRKKTSEGEKIERFKDGRTIIYERVKYYYAAEKKSFKEIMKFHANSEYFQEFIKK